MIDCGDLCLGCLDETTDGAEVQVALRPENILVTKERPDTVAASSVIEGRLDDIIPEGRACYLQLMIGQTELPVLVTNNAIEQLEVAPGDTVYAIIRNAHVKII